jgi:hypothetical protein
MGSYYSTQNIEEDVQLYHHLSNGGETNTTENTNDTYEAPDIHDIQKYIDISRDEYINELEIENKMLRESVDKYKQLYIYATK